MIKSIKIRNFRGIKSLKIKDLKKINFFLGKANNSKTSILEAIYLAISNHKYKMKNLSFVRNFSVLDDDILDSLFYGYNTSKTIKLTYIFEDKIKYKTIELDNNTNYTSLSDENNSIIGTLFFSDKNINNDKEYNYHIKCFIQNKDIKFKQKLINELEKEKIEEEFITSNNTINIIRNNLKFISENNLTEQIKKEIQKFDNRLKDIRLGGNNKPLIEFCNLSKAINIKVMGEGFQTYLSIITSIITGKKYIFIDEIENGIHFSKIIELLEFIIKSTIKQEVYFFITTHNQEILTEMSKLLLKNQYNDILSVYNVFYNKDNDVSIVNYTQENFIHAIKYNNEIRY